MSYGRSHTPPKEAPALRSNGRRVAWLVAEKVLFLASSFFVGVWVIRTLGATEFGKFSIALSITAVLASVATVGLDTVLLRRFASSVADTAASLAAAVALRLGGAVAHLALCWACARIFFGDDEQTALVTLIVASAALFRAMDVVGLRLQAQDHYARAASIRVLVRVCADTLRVGLILAGASTPWFAGAILAEAMIGAFLFACVDRRALASIVQVDRTAVRSMLREGWPIAVSGVLAGLYARIDQAVVYSALGAEANGLYAAAARISELFNLVIVSIAAVAAPHFARMHAATDSEFEAGLRGYFRTMVAMGLCIALVVGLVADPIMELLYGPAFAPAASILRFHAWSIPMVFASVALEPWFYHYGKTGLYVLKTVISLFFAAPLVVLGAHWFGSAGVAAAVVIVYAISVFATNALLPSARQAFRFQLWALFGMSKGDAR